MGILILGKIRSLSLSKYPPVPLCPLYYTAISPYKRRKLQEYFDLEVKNAHVRAQVSYLLYQIVLRDALDGSKDGEVLLHSQNVKVDVGLGAHPGDLPHLQHLIDLRHSVPIHRDKPYKKST